MDQMQMLEPADQLSDQPDENLASIPENLYSTFVHNVSHELRTPLTVLQGYAGLLHDGTLGSLTPEQQQAIDGIVNHADRLRRQVERIDTLLAIEANATFYCLISIVANVIQPVVDARRPDAEHGGLDLEVLLEDGLPIISGDVLQLRQAVDCLLENAVKFTPRGGRIQIEARADHDSVRVTITDTGIGMSPDQVQQIFRTRFYQADGSDTRRYSGYGLGLTVARSVIEAHQGQIEIASEPNRGSRISIELPAMLADLQVVEQPPLAMKIRRILVVDDEENIAVLLQAGLEKLPNCEVAIATSGLQALELFEQKPFDVLITDYNMPDMDGLLLATRVRQIHSRTAVIMITAYGALLPREQVTTADIRHVLDKPVQLAAVRDAAVQALNDSQNFPPEP
jgi:CheY-like chemotaxis protein